MNLHKIEEKVSDLCPFIKKITVTLREGYPFALIYPDFQTLESAKIINIESEIRWYGVELYNMDVDESKKIRGYKILTKSSQKSEYEDEPTDKLYKTIKSYLSTLSDTAILPSSHLELDLGLDSLDYVELFVFVEQSFGVKIDEKIFSSIMSVQALYNYIKKHQQSFNPTKIDWEEILNEDIDEKLIYSPFIMFTYKTLLLPFFKLFFRLEVKGVENIPSSTSIIAPTHQSMLDGFLIEATLPYGILKNTFFLAYKQVFGTGLMKPIAKYGQSILIDANYKLKETMQRAALPLKKGNNLVIFPEGARTRDGKLLEFRPFFAMLSKTDNIPIVPVIIDGSFEALPTGKIFPRPKKITITYLKPIYPKDLSYDELTRVVKSAIEEKL